MQFDVLNRWTRAIQFPAQITCDDHARIGVKIGLAVQWAHRTGADLRGADLTGAVLRGAVLTDAVLTGADLTDADLRGADLTDAVLTDADLRGAVLTDAVLRGVPKIENIHSAVFEMASAPGALDMGQWHCGTSHCRAGWVVTLAGGEGKALESRVGTPAAAALIYLASDPTLERIPDFYCGNELALADMKRLADAEAVR